MAVAAKNRLRYINGSMRRTRVKTRKAAEASL
jgi:hypothetical protein